MGDNNLEMLDWDNWSVKERCVGELILEMFVDKDPSGKMGFAPKDIYEGYYYCLKEMWIPKSSTSVSRRQGVQQIFTLLKYRGELVQPSGRASAYYLSVDGCLYQELQIRIANKSL